jgi:hypothetical protein
LCEASRVLGRLFSRILSLALVKKKNHMGRSGFPARSRSTCIS